MIFELSMLHQQSKNIISLFARNQHSNFLLVTQPFDQPMQLMYKCICHHHHYANCCDEEPKASKWSNVINFAPLGNLPTICQIHLQGLVYNKCHIALLIYQNSPLSVLTIGSAVILLKFTPLPSIIIYSIIKLHELGL